jgi:hypothetical protein
MDRRRFLQALGVAVVPTVAFFDIGAAYRLAGDNLVWPPLNMPAVLLDRALALELRQNGKLIMTADLSNAPELMDKDELLVRWDSEGLLQLDRKTMEVIDARKQSVTAVEAFYALDGPTLEWKYENSCLRHGADPADARLWSKLAAQYKAGARMYPKMENWYG